MQKSFCLAIPFFGWDRPDLRHCDGILLLITKAVSTLLVQLDRAKPTGPDWAQSYILKLLSLVIAEPLIALCNFYLSTRDWSFAVIIPLPKRSKHEAINYRRISVIALSASQWRSWLSGLTWLAWTTLTVYRTYSTTPWKEDHVSLIYLGYLRRHLGRASRYTSAIWISTKLLTRLVPCSQIKVF